MHLSTAKEVFWSYYVVVMRVEGEARGLQLLVRRKGTWVQHLARYGGIGRIGNMQEMQ